ncbi:MAG: enoyl-CoA hydratase/isomerase family protein [Thermodesulfobacteriota bacterium]
MRPIGLSTRDGLATVTLQRGKVNAIDLELAQELGDCFAGLGADPECRAVVLTGRGGFFSFGFDVPALYDHTPEQFTVFLTAFTGALRAIFACPKPVVAALNGHAVAGGCMLANACDARLMVAGKAKYSLNEITFGAALFAGSVEMLRYVAGSATAQAVAYGGAMYGADEALALGLVDRLCPPQSLLAEASELAAGLVGGNGEAFAAIKAQLHAPVLAAIAQREADSIAAFVKVWYSETTRRQTREIKIRG